ncbi:hypothetical protein XENORESO_016358 [Xenotaenia resolanae]|uniref:Uncharacterized protein n=1 Tax=Xenotaenia resolanae TaxID=208358 RepID=A0ABV0XB84_9TELE
MDNKPSNKRAMPITYKPNLLCLKARNHIKSQEGVQALLVKWAEFAIYTTIEFLSNGPRKTMTECQPKWYLTSLLDIQGLDNETETPVILVWEVSWLNWTSLVASLH